LFVKARDASSFAEAVSRLYNDRKLAGELGWNGWQYVSENLTTEKIGAQMYRVLASVKR
jgi:glycosyltransferase involved in cell wall biosynthesis